MVSMLNYHFACASRSVLADHKKTIYPCPTIHNVYIIFYISIVCIIKTMLKPKRPENVILTTLRDEVCAEIVVVQVFFVGFVGRSVAHLYRKWNGIFYYV